MSRAVVASLVLAGLVGGCASAHEPVADAGPVDAAQACPFDLDRTSCEAREEVADCGWAEPCAEPTIARSGCLRARRCIADADCGAGLVCRFVRLQAFGLDECVELTLCVPSDG